jgi:Tfp pilus assembly protein PilF
MNKPSIRPAALAVVVLAMAALGAPPPAAPAESAGEAEARFNAGVAHLKGGRPALALEEFRKAVKDDSRNPYFHKGLGQAYAAMNRFKEAVEAFRKALSLNPYYVDVRNDLGMALISSGKREEGKKEFLTAFNDPTNPSPELTSWNLGSAYFEEQNYVQAVEWFRTSVARRKTAPAYFGLAASLQKLGREAEALAELETGVEAFPDNASLLLGLGEAYYKAGRSGEARDRLEDAARKDPRGAGSRANELLKNFPR